VEGLPTLADGVSPRFYHAVGAQFFETMRLPIVEGRSFGQQDASGANPVVIINRRLAARLWPGKPAVGHRIKLGADSLPWRTVVGVVADVGDTANARSVAYVPYAQAPLTRVTVFVAAKTEPASIIVPMRETARSVIPDLPLLDHMTGAQMHSMTWRPMRAVAAAISAIGAVALALAAIGLYGIVAYTAVQRTREIGVRIALGADRSDVIRLVTGHGMRLVVLGILFGLAASTLVTPVMRGLLFGASPFNPFVLGASSVALVLVAALASYLPARRAASIEPMIALRTD
jgi:putative ABC transport system permease protein